MRGISLRSSGRPPNSMEQDSFDSYDDMEDMLVMTTSMNLTNSGRTGSSPGSSNNNSPSTTMVVGSNGGSGGHVGPLRNSSTLSGSEAEDDLPKSVIVTNVCMTVFDNEDIKANFEAMFREYEANPLFHYLRSFRRIRVDFESHVSAANAKRNLDGTPMGDSIIHVYFIQVLSPCTDEDAFLHVPPVEKQFLISPPSSPPVGWEQHKEEKPIVDYDLLGAVAQLSPGENHELHPAKEVNMLGKSISTPSIVVHVCEEAQAVAAAAAAACNTIASAGDNARTASNSTFGRKIRNTARPDRQSSLD